MNGQELYKRAKQIIPGGAQLLTLLPQEQAWNYLSLVVDYARERYLTLTSNELQFDISKFGPLKVQTSVNPSRFNIAFQLLNDTATAISCYIDDITITVM